MDITTSERKLAENQVVFRSFNESVQKGLDEVNAIAKEEGAQPVKIDEDTPLHFYCECSDENCKKRIKVSPKAYNKIHESRDTFTIACGHEVKKVDSVSAVHEGYCVVTKHKQPPENVGKLHVTDVDNSLK